MKWNKRVFIVWAFPKTRARELSKKFSAELFGVSYTFYLPALLRYIISSIKTVIFLLRIKPEFIFLQVPPIFLPLIVYIYTLIFGGKYILDVHSAEIFDKKWRFFYPLRRFLFLRAFWCLIHNSGNYKRIKKWGWEARALVLNDPLPEPPQVKEKRLCEHCREVVVISSFETEPYLEVLKAAEIMEDEDDYNWKIIFTGDYSKANILFKPDNTIFTGFVDYDNYWSILKGSDVIVSLDKRKEVITCGVWEGFSLEKPVITNNFISVKEVFGNSVVYTENDPLSISKAIKSAFAKQKVIKKSIQKKKSELRNRWEKNFSIIINSIEKYE